MLGLALVLAVGAAAAGFARVGSNETAETMSWGLSFPKEGERPVGNATADELKQNKAYFCASDKKKELYLTFDAGFENGYTEEILDALKKEKVPAAFFLVGTYIRDNPELTRRMEAEGHIVGNHTMNHPDMAAITDRAAFSRELAEVEAEYKTVTGAKMKKFYRPPQGTFSTENLKLASELGYTTVFWSLAYVDWYVDKQPSREEAMEKLMPRTHNGAVILLHSTSKTNAEILPELLSRWKKDGYTFKSLEDIDGKI